jgi:hypothetical protein
MRQVHRAGEKLFIDYAGQTVPLVDPDTGEMRRAHIFVAVLGASNYTYACATDRETQVDWLRGLSQAFAYFGGVTEVVVPDNPKALITVADRYEPEITLAAQRCAEHFGTVILPARPKHPQDKAKVEVGVQIVERWILARLRHQTFFSLAALNHAIADLLADLNQRNFKKLTGTRRSWFESIDQPALKPLPTSAYEPESGTPGMDGIGGRNRGHPLSGRNRGHPLSARTGMDGIGDTHFPRGQEDGGQEDGGRRGPEEDGDSQESEISYKSGRRGQSRIRNFLQVIGLIPDCGEARKR